jgi:hypothetical protein
MVELKVAKPSGKVELRPHQIAFQMGHKDCPCFVLVQAGMARKAEVLLYRAEQAEELSKYGTALPPLGKTLYPFDWGVIEKMLDMR